MILYFENDVFLVAEARSDLSRGGTKDAMVRHSSLNMLTLTKMCHVMKYVFSLALM